MTRARDLAEVISGGSLSITGAFTSPGIDDNADATAITIDSSEHVGIGTTSPDGTLHVHSATAGSVTPQTGADDLVVENSGNGGISVLTPDANRSAIVFGHASDNLKMQIRHDGGTSLSQIISDDPLTFNVSGGTERMRIPVSDSRSVLAIGDSTVYTGILSTSATNSSLISMNSGGGSEIVLSHHDALSTSGIGSIAFNRGTANLATIDSACEGATDSANLKFRTTPTGGSITERIIIQSNGYTDISNNMSTSTRNGSTSHVMHQSAGDISAFIENSHASDPYGLYIHFSGATKDNNTHYFLLCQDTTAARAIIRSNGNLQNANNAYGAISDEKLKEQIADASSQWNDIKALKIRKYKMKEDVAKGDSDEHWRLGVVAQELETSGMGGLVDDSPDLDPNTNEDLGTTTKSVKYSILYMKAVKALQEAMARIETLEADVKALKGE